MKRQYGSGRGSCEKTRKVTSPQRVELAYTTQSLIQNEIGMTLRLRNDNRVINWPACGC